MSQSSYGDMKQVHELCRKNDEAVRLPAKTGNIVILLSTLEVTIMLEECSSLKSQFLKNLMFKIRLLKYILAQTTKLQVNRL